MKKQGCTKYDSFSLDDPKGVDELVGHLSGKKFKRILDAKYEKANNKKRSK